MQRGRPRALSSPGQYDKRVKALMMSAAGATVDEVGRALDVSRRTVQLWAKTARANRRLARVAETLPKIIQCAKEQSVEALAY